MSKPPPSEHEHEERMLAAARDAEQRQQERGKRKHTQSRTRAVKPFVSPMVRAALPLLEQDLFSSRGTLSIARRMLREAGLTPEQLLVIATRTALDGISSERRLQAVAQEIGDRVESEARWEAYHREHPQAAAKLKRELRAKNLYWVRRHISAARYDAKMPKPWTPWSIKEKAHVGLYLLGYLARTGVIQKVAVRKGYGSNTKHSPPVYLALTPQAEQLMRQREARAWAEVRPWWMPTLEPPLDWSTPDDGGYHDLSMPLVKGHGGARGNAARLAAAQMPTVYTAVNAVQRTAWRINQPVLEVLRALWERGGAEAGLPRSYPAPKPERPADIPPRARREELTPEQQERLRAYKRSAADWHSEDHRRQSRSIAVLKVLQLAAELADQPRIYFPQQLDFRGRMYSAPLYLNPQGIDAARGLLTFAEPKPLGRHGAWWLAVHGANFWGEDKAAFGERVQWTLDHAAKIRAAAADPLSKLWWADADKPFQFLAFCFEWSRYLAEGESEAFQSALPVQLDLSCNGLQHFAALLRDEQLAAHVNLVPAEEPGDIYEVVAERVRAKVTEDASDASNPEYRIARQCEDWSGISRSIVKHPVMTTPYGVSKAGIREELAHLLKQARDELRLRGRELPFEDATGWGAAVYLSQMIYDSIGEEVTPAREAMKYMARMARAAAYFGQPLRWTTPIGFPVLQASYKYGALIVKTTVLGGSTSLQFNTDEQLKLSARSQAQAAAPNLIHSLDAAHLMLTIESCEREARPMSFAAIHDGYGVHAARAELLATKLRDTFAEMHQMNWLAEWAREIRSALPAELPERLQLLEPPELGSLDVSRVREADYFAS